MTTQSIRGGSARATRALLAILPALVLLLSHRDALAQQIGAPAGVFHVSVPMLGRTLVSSPLISFEDQEEHILGWDATAQQFVSGKRIVPGEAFWITNGSMETLEYFLCGVLPVHASEALSILPGLNAVGSPFAVPCDWSALGGALGQTGDRIADDRGFWRWLSERGLEDIIVA